MVVCDLSHKDPAPLSSLNNSIFVQEDLGGALEIDFLLGLLEEMTKNTMCPPE